MRENFQTEQPWRRFLFRLGDSTALSLVAVLLTTLPMTLLALPSFFTFDDLQNLDYYVLRPWESVLSNLIVFTSLRRPLGALFYLTSYGLFGLDALPLYLAGLSLFYLNLILFFWVALRLTQSRATALFAVAISAFHPHMQNVLFNFGAVYELASLSAILGAFLCYLNFSERGGRRWYVLTMLLFVAGLNAKETAVALPGLVAAYELIYRRLWARNGASLSRIALVVAPMLAVAVPFTLAKMLGREAFWRDNPLYRFQYDLTFLHNSAAYLKELTYGDVKFSTWGGLLTVAIAAGLALALRNRHMLFGVVFYLLTLAPVLFLPRVWGLFLYIPLRGVALYEAALGFDLLRRLKNGLAGQRAVAAEWRGWLRLGLALILCFTLSRWTLPYIKEARDVNYFRYSQRSRSFIDQLYRLQPTMPAGAAVGIVNPPFDPDTADKWCMYFLVWLKYEDHSLQIFWLPAEREKLVESLGQFSDVLLFKWRDGVLERASQADLEPESESQP